jgi:hypothetical protein
MCRLLGWGSWGLVVPERMKTLSQADDKEFITTQIWYNLRGLDVYNSFFHIAVLDMSQKGPSCKPPLPPPNKECDRE